MDSTLWPSIVPRLFRDAALAMADGETATVARRLQRALGLDQPLALTDGPLLEACAAATADPSELTRLALILLRSVGAQLHQQYPMSSIVWDDLRDELECVLRSARFSAHGAAWSRPAANGRTIVLAVQEPGGAAGPDVQRLSVRWGIVVPGVRFCRRVGGGTGPSTSMVEAHHHGLDCCAVVGDLTAVGPLRGDRWWLVTVGSVLECGPGPRLEIVSRNGFRATWQRLVGFCSLVSERSRLTELVTEQPWRSGVGVAEQLRNAPRDELGDLLG